MATHDEHLSQLCKRLIHLDSGRLVKHTAGNNND
jgi:predicted ABC-type transport system involved in lysophospholipase L1 biosynthesis ATPase subunit